MVKKVDENIEAKLLGTDLSSSYEDELEQKLENEIIQARKEQEKVAKIKEKTIKMKDITKLSPEERFEKNTIYRVFNRKQKTETFVDGEQAENMIRYTDDYIVKFDHRLIVED